MFGRRAPAEARAEEDGFWFRSSRLVMRRPVVMGGAVLLLALVLAAPFGAIRLNFPDDRSLPATIESRSVGDVVRSEFPAQATAAMDVILEAPRARISWTGTPGRCHSCRMSWPSSWE